MAPDFNSLGRLVSEASEERIIPGLAIGISQVGNPVLIAAYGHRQVEPVPLPATVETVYDLASLTKAVVTAVLAAKAVEQGLLQLDSLLGEHLPLLADRPEVTLGRVLAHAGGFPAHRKFYESLFAAGGVKSDYRATILEQAAAEPLAYQPGARSLYSDLGFILLGALIEQVMGARLDVLADRLIFRPLGLSTMTFVPQPGRLSGREVAPTERCPVRRRMVEGEVHDLNAYAMGGIAGHAGLFGSIGDLLELALALCAAYHGRGRGGGSIEMGTLKGSPNPPAMLRSRRSRLAPHAPLVGAEVWRRFWSPAGIPGSTWRLGWDGPATEGSLAGSLLSRRAVGHLSFTGCSLWIDPEQETCVAVLCNRVHPEVRDDPRFRALRPRLNDEALRAIGYQAR